MDIIKWRAAYATGISSMDIQHQKLIGLINKMYTVLRNEEPDSSIQGVLDEMAEYAESHLKDEETILESNDYPDFANHLAIHKSYLDKLKVLMTEWQNEDKAAAMDIYTFLRQWWMGHIVTEDQKYGEFLKDKGIK
ncbi:MAG: bacteriohemerythrin [Proteobacteria bacterium]|jgi:hemerythrin-like metal-binding protein|nr:bacteriohemerythrin [Desulfocapsa sp.]MBU3946247.1 bacteriohemerythrin [Pseudomonadota bacterium]MCG2742459.1 bacteriohemerythrin [Desulfobacteraceae bacterium]MBU3983282.1 bacteriohemerythrin [Pseudomonadota bacterium]MBU4044402.1 bacteriohemerythrin [Pseudomonadota bacterium]